MLTTNTNLKGEWFTMIIGSSIGPLALTITGDIDTVKHLIKEAGTTPFTTVLSNHGHTFIITELDEVTNPPTKHDYKNAIAFLPITETNS